MKHSISFTVSGAVISPAAVKDNDGSQRQLGTTY
jgi:hypothetical protein